MAFQNLWIVITKISLYVVKRHKSIKYRAVIADKQCSLLWKKQSLPSEPKAWVRRVLLPGSDAASPRSPTSSRRISLHRWTMVEDPRRPLLKTTAPLRELPTPIASNRPPASLTCGTRQWHHLFQGQQLTGGCGSMVFQARYPALSLSYPANRRKNVYSLHRSIPSGRWRTGSKSSSLMNRNSSWVMATGDPVFGGKSTKGTRRLVWSALSSIRPPFWSGDACHPEELEVCASCLPRRQSTRRCTSIC